MLSEGENLLQVLGETLLELQKAIGTERMKAAAQSLSEKRRVRSTDEMVAALARVHQQGDIKSKVRRGDKRLVFEFYCAVGRRRRLARWC